MAYYAKKTGVVISVFFIILLCFIIFLSIVYVKMITPRKLPTNTATRSDTSIRGSLYTSDGFEVAYSDKLYKASVNTQSIDPDKKELFITLFSIYSGISQDEIRKKLNQKGYVVLSYTLNSTAATNLKNLNLILIRYDVFREYEDKRGRIIQKMGLSIQVSGNNRNYVYKNILEPLIGYTRKVESQNITRVDGVKGVEKYYNDILSPKQDGSITGKRDVGFNIIANKAAMTQGKQYGLNVTLSIPLKLQKKIEYELDEAKKRYKVREIIAGVMDSKTGRILSLATSNRFDPKNIQQKDYPNLNFNAIEYSYEPGSTIKPIIYAILLQKGMISPEDIIELDNGYYKLKSYTIRDTHPLKSASAEDVIVRSSNIGMVKISKDLKPNEYHIALHAFGFGEPSGIDLPYEKTGLVPSPKTFHNEVYRASVSYGYGMRATFIQLMRSYAIFSNGGYLVTPRVSEYVTAPSGEKYMPKRFEPIAILSPQTTQQVHNALVQVVKKVIKIAQIEGIITGGKTGTARIASNGKYDSKYNGSFFGFAQDENNAYTIGVVAFESDIKDDYYGSRTAAPIFARIVNILVEDGYLKPIEPNIESSADEPQTAQAQEVVQ